MDIKNIQEQLDYLYSQGKNKEAYQLLLDMLKKAMEENRDDIVLFLLSELMGYYRVTSQFELGNKMALQSLKIINNHGIEDSIDAATLYLNIATLYRVEGLYDSSLDMYHKCEKIYNRYLNEYDERMASFFNNISLLYQELGDYNKALDYELQALNIVQHLFDCKIEEAITYTNLASIYKCMEDNSHALKSLNRALELFEEYGKNDPHYLAALSQKAQYLYEKKDYKESIDLYNKILIDIEKVYGKSKEYYIVQENMKKVIADVNHSIKGLDLCYEYYLKYGKPMLEEYKEYLPYMAIGLFGMGSDCLGYDDEISVDHDFGPGFVILLPRDIYLKIGKQLQESYNQLPEEFMGYKRLISKQGCNRVGVYSINDYLLSLIKKVPITNEDWLNCNDQELLSCVNGRIFEDYYGEITRIRDCLKYYPEEVRRIKLANSIALMAQSGQYNYSRCMKRKDELTANLALYKFIEETLSCVYLLNKEYKPYYKWSFKGLEKCKRLKDIKMLLEELMQLPSQKEAWYLYKEGINYNDKKVVIIEKISQRIIKELQHQQLTKINDSFLDNHIQFILEDYND